MSTTEDPRLRVVREDGMQETYLVLSAEERAKGWVRPYRDRYRHVGVRPRQNRHEVDWEPRRAYWTGKLECAPRLAAPPRLASPELLRADKLETSVSRAVLEEIMAEAVAKAFGEMLDSIVGVGVSAGEASAAFLKLRSETTWGAHLEANESLRRAYLDPDRVVERQEFESSVVGYIYKASAVGKSESPSWLEERAKMAPALHG